MNNFKELAKEYAGIELNDTQIEQFSSLANFLLETNKVINLTAIRDIEGVYIKHFLDSLTLFKGIPKDTKFIADIGSGAGFPGLPLAIANPNMQITMIESIGKKVNFIKSCLELLKLKNANVVNERAEKLANDKRFRGEFDVVTARAVTALPELIQLCLPMVKENGVIIAMKNINQEELDSAERVLIGEKLEIKEIVEINIPDLSPRQLIVIGRI
jgi:16S rRNA (guanine527-N7)-methyltransferase